MCLRFVFLLITQVASWLRLSRRKEAWKTAEILILRHQLTVLQRHQARRPKLTWADRALLATLASVISRARRRGLRLLVTPDTILRWHREIRGFMASSWKTFSVPTRQQQLLGPGKPNCDPPPLAVSDPCCDRPVSVSPSLTTLVFLCLICSRRC